MIHIKSIKADELNDIIDLARLIWPVSYAHILTQEQINNMLDRIYSLENLKKEMRSGHIFFIAILDTQKVGYVSAYQEESIVWLKKLYILPTLQGQGIGKQLINVIIKAFPKSQEIRLLVNRDNLHAQQFYLRQHFIKIDEIPVKMGDFNFVDFVFSKKIKPTIT
ncbi:MAG: GNAT family N-acetyltransferase [Alphaproteobacteria bacterium]|nr:GNAT family N-acetyltransferase [Alphaproteobacteria bacterium]